MKLLCIMGIRIINILLSARSLAQLPKGNVNLLFSQSNGQAGEDMGPTLASKVRKAPAAVIEMLRSVHIADSLEAALALRSRIGKAGSVITRDGVWISGDWLRVMRDKDSEAGILAREQEMRKLKQEIQELHARHASAGKLLKDGRATTSMN